MSSSCFVYELPTTGSVSFNDFCVDKAGRFTSPLADATSARANVRAALKESKRTDGEKDYLKVLKILDDYLPHLYGVIAATASGDIELPAEPVFSWRTTLSANILHNSPRISITGLPSELSFTLLTYAFVLSNLASSIVAELGPYEHDRHISDTDRKAKDEKLNFAVNLLCRASGIFLHLSEKVIPEWSLAPATTRPVDLTTEVTMALSKLSLADAQTLAIRKLLSKSAFDSNLSPGPPLPKSHPSPSLIAKLYLSVTAMYASARSLAKTSSSGGDGEVSQALRAYLADATGLATALAHKWLGVDAGEQVAESKSGEAVGFLKWAKEELEGLKGGGSVISSALGKGKEVRAGKKERLADELASVNAFLNNYRKINDTLHFQPIPHTATLQSLVPAGRAAIATKPFQPPEPAFDVGSTKHVKQESNSESQAGATGSYAGAGAYF